MILNNLQTARQAQYQHVNHDSCLKGTRGALLDEIDLWTRDFDRQPVYWLNGLAGTGKSTIAQTIAERTFGDGRLGASFFCSRDFEDRRNLQLIFPTLAVQLAQRYTAFRSIFVPLVQSDPEIGDETLYGQLKKLIVQPLAESGISTVIVIDALDECKDQDKQPASVILSVLGRLVADIPGVKFFITGRPESRIREGFRLPLLAKATDVFLLHEIDPSQVNSDIQLFLRHSFLQISGRRGGLDGWPVREDVDRLCKRSAGLFVHAVATVRFIDYKAYDPKRQLERLLRWPDRTKHEGKTKLNAKTTLDMLYTSILREAFGDNNPESDPRVQSILGSVILAVNPLSPSAIAVLLGLEPGDVFPFLSSICSLLVLHEDLHHPVKPFHKSFPDFIIDPSRCINPRFCICPRDQHAKLLISCLELMNKKLEQNMCKLPDGVSNSEIDDLSERAEQYIDPALQYACKSWHKHLIEVTSSHKDSIIPFLSQFLEKKFLFWLEVLSVLDIAREAVDALNETANSNWLEVC